MEPAQTIFRICGGAPKVAEITGVHRTRVYAWLRPKEDGGTGGRIPQNHIPSLLRYARDNGLDLNADDFLLMDEAERAAS